jgi:phosphatidylglycerophosphate synthase
MFKLKKSQIPNILTIIRMILAIVVCVFLFVPFGNIIYHIKTDFRLSFLLAGILFAIASITDFLDGYLARKYN